MANKREKLIEFNKKNIIEASKSLFSVNGVAKTTVDDIAKEADYSKATIYVYFKSKEDIYYHIVLEYMIALRDSVIACFSSNSNYESAYYDFCDILVKFEQEYPMYFEYIIGRISVEKEKFEELSVLKDIYSAGKEINKIVYNFLNQAKEDGFVKNDIDVIQGTFVIWSSVVSLISFSKNKQNYLEECLGFDRKTFLENGFLMILTMVKN